MPILDDMRIMVFPPNARLRRRLAEEQGIAMVLVVGMSAILFALAAIVLTRNFSDYNQVRNDRRFEQAIQVADSGVDHTLYKVGSLKSYSTGETLPTSFPSTEAEEDWVLANAADNALVTTPEGQWATIRPMNAEVIYSVGYVPTRAAPFKVRVIRAAYDYAPFVPSVAILTDGDLEIQGNASITGPGGSVHANGNVSLSGSPEIHGYVSAREDCDVSGGTVINPLNPCGGQPPREVPLIDPRENYAKSEYDLCPNGDVRTGPDYSDGNGFFKNTSGVPCGGDLLGDGDGQGYRGWKVSVGSPALWKYNDDGTYGAVFYIYQGSADISGNPGSAQPWEVTILAEAISSGAEPGHCPHLGGDIVVTGGANIVPAASAEHLQFIAGRDLKLHGNPGSTWEGVYAAHEQFDISGNTNLTGVVIANDYCDSAGSPVSQATVNLTGSAHIFYDGTWEIPIGKRVRTTHWNEI